MSYFITGTDTGVGKTLISCALLHAFAAQGQRVVGMKPVAVGCDDNGHNQDVKQLQAASNVLVSYGQIISRRTLLRGMRVCALILHAS